MKIKNICSSVFASIIGIGFLFLSFVTMAEEFPDKPHLITSGQSTIYVMPDKVTLTLEANVLALDAAEAKKQVDECVMRYLDFVYNQNIDKKNIHTANLRVYPKLSTNDSDKQELKGYYAARKISITLNQIEKLNPLMDAAVKLNINEIKSVNFGVANMQQYQAQARESAIENAKQQAKAVARGFNAELGSIYSIRYAPPNQLFQPSVMAAYKTETVKSDAASTYEPQPIAFDDRVDVIFLLKKKSSSGETP